MTTTRHQQWLDLARAVELAREYVRQQAKAAPSCFGCSGTGRKPCEDCDGEGVREGFTDHFEPMRGTHYTTDASCACETCGGSEEDGEKGSGEVSCAECGGSGEDRSEVANNP